MRVGVRVGRGARRRGGSAYCERAGREPGVDGKTAEVVLLAAPTAWRQPIGRAPTSARCSAPRSPPTTRACSRRSRSSAPSRRRASPAAAQGGGPRAARGVRDGGAGGPGSGDARRAARPRLGRRVRRVDPQRDALGRRARDRHARRALRRRGGRHVVRVDALAAVRRRRPRGAPAVHRAALRPARRRGRRRRAQLRRRRRRRRRRRARGGGARWIARAHNEERARRAKERRVQRLKCAGCGAILADAAAFQLHCGEVDHDDDFTCAAPRAAQFFSAILRAILRCEFLPSSDRARPHTRAGTTASRSRSC